MAGLTSDDDGSPSSNGLLSISETYDLCDITFSREATVAAFTDYYAFLSAMYLDSTVIQEPPQGGWPDITTEKMRALGKPDEVMALLRRLPYTRPGPGNSVEGAFVSSHDAVGSN
jgi:hypothetical protein